MGLHDYLPLPPPCGTMYKETSPPCPPRVYMGRPFVMGFIIPIPFHPATPKATLLTFSPVKQIVKTNIGKIGKKKK